MTTPPPPREKEVTKTVLRHLNKIDGCYAHKMHGSIYGNGGEPDIDACINGRTVKIEMKAPGRKPKPTAIQEVAMQRWRDAGAVVILATSWAEVEAALIEAGLITKENA